MVNGFWFIRNLPDDNVIGGQFKFGLGCLCPTLGRQQIKLERY